MTKRNRKIKTVNLKKEMHFLSLPLDTSKFDQLCLQDVFVINVGNWFDKDQLMSRRVALLNYSGYTILLAMSSRHAK